MTAIQVSTPAAQQPPRPAPASARRRLFSDKRLMDNPEGDRRILRRARELADRRNHPDDGGA